jgi:hypothetical protein
MNSIVLKVLWLYEGWFGFVHTPLGPTAAAVEVPLLVS